MKTSRSPLRHVLSALACLSLAATLPAMAQTPANGGDAYLIYLPSTSPSVDHLSLINAFGEMGFTVHTMAFAGESQSEYARRIAKHVRSLMAEGVAPEAITVLGAGSGSPIAALTSAVTGHRRVNYALLGQCDRALKDQHHIRMSGRVIGIRADSDSSSGSCRALWQGSPKISQRQDLVVSSPLADTFFDQPRKEWLQALSDWSLGGRVDVGNIRVSAIDTPSKSHTGAGD